MTKPPASPASTIAPLLTAVLVLFVAPAVIIGWMIWSWRHPAAAGVLRNTGTTAETPAPAPHSPVTAPVAPAGAPGGGKFAVSAWFVPDGYAWPMIMPQAQDGVGAVLVGFNDYFDTPRQTTLADLHVHSGQLEPGQLIDIRSLEHPLLSHGDGHVLYSVDDFWEKQSFDKSYAGDKANLHLRWWPRLPGSQQTTEFIFPGLDREHVNLAAVQLLSDKSVTLLTTDDSGDYQGGEARMAESWTLRTASVGAPATAQKAEPTSAQLRFVWLHGSPGLALFDPRAQAWTLDSAQQRFQVNAELTRLAGGHPDQFLTCSDDATVTYDDAPHALVIKAGQATLQLKIRNPYQQLPDGTPRSLPYNYQNPHLTERSSKPYVKEQALRYQREGRQAPLDCVADGTADNGGDPDFVRYGIRVLPCGPGQFAIADSAYQRVLLVICPH